jgi:glycine/D-amino acid oxidase-like deaminating enzyme
MSSEPPRLCVGQDALLPTCFSAGRPHPTVKNFVFANGFSGHGLQQSPAVGRAISELVLQGGFKSIDLAAFGFERVLENRPLLEKNVV